MFDQDQIKYDEWNKDGVGAVELGQGPMLQGRTPPSSHLFINLHFWDFFYSEIEMCRIKIRSTIFLDLILKSGSITTWLAWLRRSFKFSNCMCVFWTFTVSGVIWERLLRPLPPPSREKKKKNKKKRKRWKKKERSESTNNVKLLHLIKVF